MKAFSRVDVNIVKFAQSLHKKFVCDIKLAAAACAQQFMDDIFWSLLRLSDRRTFSRLVLLKDYFVNLNRSRKLWPNKAMLMQWG